VETSVIEEDNAQEKDAKPPIHDLGNNQLILVVEDDAGVRELAVSMLRELGYLVIQADGAASALRELAENPGITLLFTDIVMPVIDGRQLADQALLHCPDLKVLFTTGFTRTAIFQGGVLEPGLNFIAKPFTMDQLAAKIRAVLAPAG
jgi:CheY-like chemotaxis protein